MIDAEDGTGATAMRKSEGNFSKPGGWRRRLWSAAACCSFSIEAQQMEFHAWKAWQATEDLKMLWESGSKLPHSKAFGAGCKDERR